MAVKLLNRKSDTLYRSAIRNFFSLCDKDWAYFKSACHRKSGYR